MTDATMLELAVAVAGLIGDGWTAQPTEDGRGVHLDHARNGSLFAAPDSRHPARLRVRGSAAPSHPRQVELLHHLDLGHITVSIGRGPDAIAEEIRRRLLPVYESGLARYRARLADLEAAAAAREDVLGRISRACEGEQAHGCVRWQARRHDPEQLSWGSFTALRDGQLVKADLWLHADTAEHVARVLALHDSPRRMELLDAIRQADVAAHGDSNDTEIQAVRDALELAVRELGIGRLEANHASGSIAKPES